MKHVRTSAGVAALTALAVTASLATLGTSAAAKAPAKAATVKEAHTSSGTILVDSSGFTLYTFSADGKNKDTCAKHAGCLTAWPAYTVSGKPTAGSGVKASLLGTISLGKGKQVTYAGHPLYRYAFDSAPASTGYIGASSFGGTWYGISPAGKAVH